MNTEHIACALGIRNPGTDELQNLELGILMAVNRIIHVLTHGGHEPLAGLGTILELDGQVLVDTEGQLGVSVNPLAGLVVLGRGRVDVLQSRVLAQCHALDFGRNLLRQNLELERNRCLCRVDLVLELCQKLVLSTRRETLEVANVAVNILLIGVDFGLHELYETANILGLLVELVLLGLLRAALTGKVGNEKLDAATDGAVVLFLLIVFILL